jgi:hypothetical protein
LYPEKTVTPRAYPQNLTIFLAYRRVITSESLKKGISKVYTADIAKHAMLEIEKAVEKSSSAEDAGIVFDVKLFESLIVNGRFISDPK